MTYRSGSYTADYTQREGLIKVLKDKYVPACGKDNICLILLNDAYLIGHKDLMNQSFGIVSIGTKEIASFLKIQPEEIE